MSISSVSSRGSSAIDVTPSDDYSSRTDAASSRFAAMLANAIEPQRTDAPAPVAKDASSELDAPDGSSDDTSPEPAAKSPDKTTPDAAGVTNAAAVILGRTTSGLDPALRTKLTRVIERMRDEEGKTVTVAEGLRSQTRQNALFAQGRTTDGPVVTWTRNSQHIKGLAADLSVDGGFTDKPGFDALRRIAEEEGLHTLGKIDPGHVELTQTVMTAKDSATSVASALRGRSDVLAPTNAALRAIAIPLASTPQIARVATTARVATVASVASVAAAGAARTAAANVKTSSSGAKDQSTGSNSGGDKQSAKADVPAPPNVDATLADRAYAAFSRADATSTGNETLQISGPDIPQSAARVDKAMDMQDARGAKSISHLSLSLDDGRGGEDVVRVGMRGSTVGASFDMRDAGNADRVASRLGELTRSLERRGLEPQTFQVRSTSSQDGSVATTRVATAQTVSTGDAAMRQQDQAGARGESRQPFSRQQEQQDRAQERSNDRRRRDSIFSLTPEDA